jgi:hypothetical protein
VVHCIAGVDFNDVEKAHTWKARTWHHLLPKCVLVAICLPLGLLTRLLPRAIRRLAPPMAMQTCSRRVGVVCVSDRAFLTAVKLTIIPYGLQESCLSIRSDRLLLQRPLEDAQKRRGNARQSKAASIGEPRLSLHDQVPTLLSSSRAERY